MDDLGPSHLMTDLFFVYLVQGEAKLLSRLHFPPDASVFALCYDQNISLPYAEQTLFDPACSWAAGRNKLLALARSRYPEADYYVLCDDDIEFVEGSFEQFEHMVAQTCPAVAVPVVPKTANVARWDLDVQVAIALDEQMVALHHSVVGLAGVAPLTEDYDDFSWYVPCLIFEYLVLKFHSIHCHQYNKIVIANTRHRQGSSGSTYKCGDWNLTIATFETYIGNTLGDYDRTIINLDRDPTILADRRRRADLFVPLLESHRDFSLPD